MNMRQQLAQLLLSLGAGGFQVRQAFADGRCRDVLALGSATNAAQFAHGDEQLKRGEIDAARKTAL